MLRISAVRFSSVGAVRSNHAVTWHRSVAGRTTASLTRDESRRASLSAVGAVADLLRWLPCVGRSQRLVAPTPSPIACRPLTSAHLPPMPLTQRELFTVVRSWKSIQSQITDTGMRMFLR